MTAGAGHRRAAEALAQAARDTLPGVEVCCQDLLDDMPGWLRRGYPLTYYFLVRHLPAVWGSCFKLFDSPAIFPIVQPIRHAWNLLMGQRFLQRLRKDAPSCIVVTHFFPADLLGAAKRAGWLNAPLVVVITDVHPHCFWLSASADAYVLATPESAKAAQHRGVNVAKLHALGIPISGDFSAALDQQAVRARLGLASDRLTVLVTSGGTTIGPFETVVNALIDLEKRISDRVQLLIVCGDSAHVRQRIEDRARKSAMPIKVFGFVDTMPELMASSDVIVAKSGGLTVTEALGRGLPLVLYHAIPGQEFSNARYVSRYGAAIMALSPKAVCEAIRGFADDPRKLSLMRDAARSLAHPDAARDIISQVVTPFLQKAVHDA